MLYPKIVAGISAAGLILAQIPDVPEVGNWAKTPVEVLCAIALAWVSIRTIPGMLHDMQEAQEKLQLVHREEVDRILSAYSSIHTQMSLMMGEKLQQQTETLSRVIREGSFRCEH